MSDNVTGSPVAGAPPADFSAFDRPVIERLLGKPDGARVDRPAWGRTATCRALQPKEWPHDKTGRPYLHRALAALLASLGGTVEAVAEILRRLEDGELLAVIVGDIDGRERGIPPETWRGELAARKMLREGRDRGGFIYLKLTPRTPLTTPCCAA